jgi:hypothetical protein
MQEQLLADQDMEEIRNKRANIHGDRGGHTQARNAEPAGGALKNKYRKRSVGPSLYIRWFGIEHSFLL